MNYTIKDLKVRPSNSESDYLDFIYGVLTFVDEDEYIHLMNNEISINLTKDWLYDSKATNYELIVKKVESSAPYDSKFCIDRSLVLDYFHQYLIDEFIKKDVLRPHLEKGRKINLNAIYVWFKQYCVREKYIEGKDSLQRCRGARTQSEVKKMRSYEDGETTKLYVPSHNMKNLESKGFQVAKIVEKFDSDTGEQQGETDYYADNVKHLDHDLEQRSMNDHVRFLIEKKFGKENVNKYYSLYMEMLNDEFANNKKRWSEARKVTKRILNYQIDQIENLIRSHASDFGY